jgi:hypothetical protein
MDGIKRSRSEPPPPPPPIVVEDTATEEGGVLRSGIEDVECEYWFLVECRQEI